MPATPLARVPALARARAPPLRAPSVARASLARRPPLARSRSGGARVPSARLGRADPGALRALTPPRTPRRSRRLRGAPASPRACWSLEVSVATSAFVAATVATLLRRGDARSRGHALVLGVFGSMQLVDAALWWIHGHGAGLEACDLANRGVTRLGLAIICAEPLASLVGCCGIAGRKPPPLAVAAYSAIFLLTPLAGESLVLMRPASSEGSSLSGTTERLFHGTVPSEPPPPGSSSSPGVVPSKPSSPASSPFERSWASVFASLDRPCVCSSVTEGGHLMYGGADVAYRHLLSPWDRTEPCVSRATGEVVRASREIPLALRLAFLAGIAAPFAALVEPRACGWSHAGVLTLTWLIGASSDAHASVWCLANVAQGALMLAERDIWPEIEKNPAGVDGPGVRSAASSSDGATGTSDTRAPSGASAFSPALTPSRWFDADAPARRWPRLDAARVAELEADPPDFVVVGSGVGGLAFAALATKAGRRVVVLERHYRAGGCSHAFSEVGDGGDVFDTGIHYVGMSPTFRWMLGRVSAKGRPMRFAAIGSPEDGFAYDVVDLGKRPSSEESSDSEERLAVTLRRDALAESFAEAFPAERANIERYFEATARGDPFGARSLLGSPFVGLNALVLAKLVPVDVGGPFGAVWNVICDRVRLWLLRRAERAARPTATEVASAFVRDPALVAALASGQMIDWNLPGDETAWVVSAGMSRYYAAGGFYPVGGASHIAETMARVVEEGGGAVLCDADVEEVVFDEERPSLSSNAFDLEEKESDPPPRASGVRLAGGGAVVRATRGVVLAAGFANAFERMIPRAALRRAQFPADGDPRSVTSRVRPSRGHCCAFVSLDGTPESLGLTGANVHSFGDALGPEFGYDVGRMTRAWEESDFERWVVTGKKKEGNPDDRSPRKASSASGVFGEPLVCMTFPCAKNPERGASRAGRSDAILLVEAPLEWFERFERFTIDGRGSPLPARSTERRLESEPLDAADTTSAPIALEGKGRPKRRPSSGLGPRPRRPRAYAERKAALEALFLDRLHRHFPRTRGRVRSVTVSTPLTARRFLASASSYGLEWTPEHFDAEIQDRWLGAKVRGAERLFLTGECVAFGGFYGAVACGFISAMHALGFAAFARAVAFDETAEPPVVAERTPSARTATDEREGATDAREGATDERSDERGLPRADGGGTAGATVDERAEVFRAREDAA
jgi:all-trans-retinol 13,14-reductase